MGWTGKVAWGSWVIVRVARERAAISCPSAPTAAFPACRHRTYPPLSGPALQYEWRFGALVRLVKLWARKHDINDSANGSLNSFALTLLVGRGARCEIVWLAG